MLAILLIPAALCYTFGRMVGDTRQGWALLAAMTVVFVGSAGALRAGRAGGQSRLAALGVDQARSATQAGGNMEGKEVALRHRQLGAVGDGDDRRLERLGQLDARLVTRRSAAWCRCVLMQLGEVIFGGVGSGLYGMLVFAIVAVFVAGLMVGRTPEYLGKKIEAFEMKMAVARRSWSRSLVVLVGTAIAVVIEPGAASIANPGAHGFSEMLYAFSSAGNNNGSAFAGLARQHAVLQHRARASRCWSRATGSSCRCWRIAGSLAAQEDRPGRRGHAADAHAAVRRAAGRRRCSSSAR